MKKAIILTLILSLPLILAQCNQSQDEERDHMMDNQQVGQMMNNLEQREAIMTQMMQNPEHRQTLMMQMAENPDMRNEFMTQLNASMMNEDHETMLDRMEAMMNNPEQREQLRAQMQSMMEMLDSDAFDRDQMREMMEQSPMMGMQMNCMQMMSDM